MDFSRTSIVIQALLDNPIQKTQRLTAKIY